MPRGYGTNIRLYCQWARRPPQSRSLEIPEYEAAQTPAYVDHSALDNPEFLKVREERMGRGHREEGRSTPVEPAPTAMLRRAISIILTSSVTCHVRLDARSCMRVARSSAHRPAGKAEERARVLEQAFAVRVCETLCPNRSGTRRVRHLGMRGWR